MTNHIEELMKAAGVEPEKRFKECKENAKNIGVCANYPCISCKKSVFIDKYPDFTPAKQLELIKLLSIGNGINYHFDLHKYKLFDKWEFTSYVNTGGTRIEHTDFEQGLAELVLRMILAGHIDKSEVKRILEDAN